MLLIILIVTIMLIPVVVIIKMRKKGDVNTDLNMSQSTQPETMLASVERDITLQENVAYGLESESKHYSAITASFYQ